MADIKGKKGIWKYLHHLLSGAVILIEGILLMFLSKSLFFSWLFIIIGAILVIDDIFAETINKSLIGKINSDPIKLKIIGVLFFLCMEVFFFLLIFLF